MRRIFVSAAPPSFRGRVGSRAVAFSTTTGSLQRRPPQGGSQRGWSSTPPTQEGRDVRGRGPPPPPFPPRRRSDFSGGPDRAFRGEGERGGGPRGFGGRGERRESSLAQNAPILVDLKRKCKQAKSLKERNGFLSEARHLVRRTSIDPSTQDEKSVAILLNSCVTFNCHVEENIEQAVQWMRRNLGGLSPQNVALFTNAVGALDLEDGKQILFEEIVPIIKSRLEEMTPVEIVMILQAFQRLRVEGREELQCELVQLLEPCIDAMHISELSTLAIVLGWSPIKTRNEAQWRAMAAHIMTKVMADVDRMHSKEAITFLTASTLLPVEQDHIVQLLRRVTNTSGFHTDEQVGELFRALARIQKTIENPKDTLTHACGDLQKALLVRLERVAQFASMKSTTTIWIFSSFCGVELPATVQTQLLKTVTDRFVYYQPRIAILYKFVKAAGTQKLPSTEIFNAISDFTLGKRPPRPGQDEPHSVSSNADDSIMFRRDFFFSRYFSDLVSLRLYLENVFAVNGATAPDSLTTTLPQELLAHVGEVLPKQALTVVKRIALAPFNELRNTENDEALLSSIEARIKREGSDFMREIPPAILDSVVDAIADNPKTKNIAELLAKRN